jgi:hypothetical protein
VELDPNPHPKKTPTGTKIELILCKLKETIFEEIRLLDSTLILINPVYIST